MSVGRGPECKPLSLERGRRGPREVSKWLSRMTQQVRGRASLHPGQVPRPLRVALSWKDFQLSKAPLPACCALILPASWGAGIQSLELAQACTHLLLFLGAKKIRRRYGPAEPLGRRKPGEMKREGEGTSLPGPSPLRTSASLIPPSFLQGRHCRPRVSVRIEFGGREQEEK